MYKSNPASPVAHIEPPQQLAHMMANLDKYPKVQGLHDLSNDVDAMWDANTNITGRTGIYSGAHPAQYVPYVKKGKTCWDVPVRRIVTSILEGLAHSVAGTT